MNKPSKFDLAKRTKSYARLIIQYCSLFPQSASNSYLVNQLLRSGTSIGANYLEAEGAGSRKEFLYRLSLCKREAKETSYWLDLISGFSPDPRLHQQIVAEVGELESIFSSALLTASRKDRLKNDTLNEL